MTQPQPSGSPALELLRWACPLIQCGWSFASTEQQCRCALLAGGEIREHINQHDVLEWVQELIDARRASQARGQAAREEFEADLALRASFRIGTHAE